MNFEFAKEIVDEIKKYDMEENECAYVHANGEIVFSNSGCQPSNTVAVGPDDFFECTTDEIADNLASFFRSPY